jgi:ABC-type sugar transport system substrate-binding protein
MSRVLVRSRSVLCGLLALSALTAGCGGGGEQAADSSASPNGEAASADGRYATLLDDQLKGSNDNLPAVKVAVPGGGEVSFDEGEPLKIAYVGFGKGFDYTTPQYAAAEEAGAEYGAQVDDFDPAGDGQKQVTQLQDVMNSGKYNAVAVYPIAMDLVCDLLSRQMPAKGILVVAHGNAACADTSAGGVLSTVPETANTEGTYTEWATLISDDQNGPQKAIVLVGPQADDGSKQAVVAVNEVFPRHDIEVVALRYTDFSTPDALQKVQDALQTHPDVTLIASSFPEGTRAAVSAVKSAGKTGKIALYDHGGAKSILAQIKAGTVKGSAPTYPYTDVKAAIQALVLARRGEDVPDVLPYAGHAPESMRPSGAQIMWVTKDNVDAFETIAEF